MHAKEDSLDTARVLREMMNVCADGVRNVKGDPEAEAYYLKTAGDLSKNIARRMGSTLGLSEAGMGYVAAQAAIPYYRKRAEVMSRHGKLMKAHQYKKDLKELEKVPNPARQDERITRLCSDSQAGETGTAQDRILPGGNQVPMRSVFIDDLCVDAECRSQGVGKALFQFVADRARELGCYEVTLNVWEGNDAARRFYDARGMKPKETQMELIL